MMTTTIEMVAGRVLEKYGIGLTVEQLVACRRDFVTTDAASDVLYSDQHVGRNSHPPRQAD